MGNFWKASHLSVCLSGAAVRSGEIPAQARVLLRAALSSFVRFLQNPLPGLLTSLYTSDKI